jgi:tol-pal system protein YbgF
MSLKSSIRSAGLAAVLAICIGAYSSAAMAEATVEERSVGTSEANNLNGDQHQESIGSAQTYAAPDAIKQEKFIASTPIVQSKSSASPAVPASSGTNGTEAVDTSNLSVEQRISRLEQQVNYINRSNAQGGGIGDLQKKIEKAQGDLEVQQHKIQSLEKQLNDFYLDLEQKIDNKNASAVNTESKKVGNAEGLSDQARPLSVTKKKGKKGNGLSDEAVAIAADVGKKGVGSKNAKYPVVNGKGLNTSKFTQTNDNAKAAKVAPVNADDSSNSDIQGAQGVAQKAQTPVSMSQKGAAAASSSPGQSVDEQKTYQSAFEALQNREYDIGTKKLQAYLDRYPHGFYVPNAHYWLGEIYFNQSLYAKASSEFDVVVSDYQKSTKVPEAMFKLAYIHEKQGKVDQAKKEYLAIKKRFPKTGAAKLAEQQMQMSSQGNGPSNTVNG